MKTIHISLSPNVEADDIGKAILSLLAPWSWKEGSKLREAEQWLSSYHDGAEVALASSGRSALYAAFKALGIGDGDEVIVQAFTCITVPACVQWVGATPIYADIDPATYNLNPAEVEKNITSKTKAIIVQHTFGIPGPVEELQKIAREHNLFLIEDCAHALGATYHGKPVGIWGDVAILSFGRDKALSCVFGGAVVSKNVEVIKAVRDFQKSLPLPPHSWVIQQLLHPVLATFSLISYSWAGLGKALLVLSQRLGLLSKAVSAEEKEGDMPPMVKWRFSPAFASLLLNQLSKLEKYANQRRQITKRYLDTFDGVKPLVDTNPSWLRFPYRSSKRDEIMQTARKNGIILGDWYSSPVAPCDADCSAVGYEIGSCPEDEKAAQEILNLPTHPRMKDRDIERVLECIKRAC